MALHPEYREEFDSAYRAALEEAGRSLDLAALIATVEHWRMRSWITRDREEYRRIMRYAAELLNGVVPPEDEPVAVTERRL